MHRNSRTDLRANASTSENAEPPPATSAAWQYGGPLRPSPDRLLPSDPAERSIARRLYDSVRDLPLVSPHGHVDPAMLAANHPFTDPASLLVTPDHYVTRLLHANGLALNELGLTDAEGHEPAPPREVWRRFCAHWPVFLGTASRQWLESELHDVLGVTVQPSPETADALFDEITDVLARPDMRPRTAPWSRTRRGAAASFPLSGRTAISTPGAHRGSMPSRSCTR